MSQLLRTEPVEISGKTFVIKVLPFKESRVVLPVIQRALASFDPELGEHGSLLLAGISGQLSEKDMDVLVEKFAAATTVDFQDGDGDSRPSRVVLLKDCQNEVFAGQLEDMYTWLDAAVKLNYGGLIAKTAATITAVAGLAKRKADQVKAGKAE